MHASRISLRIVPWILIGFPSSCCSLNREMPCVLALLLFLLCVCVCVYLFIFFEGGVGLVIHVGELVVL